MTTPPVVSITDELIADLEAAANAAGGAEWMLIDGEMRMDADNRYVTSKDRIDDNKVPFAEIHYGNPDAGMGEPFQGEQVAAGYFMALANPATILALLAERADLKLQLAAARVDAKRWRDIVQSFVDEIPHRSAVRGNAPGHGHDVPGIWDSDNGPLAGKECAWCKTWHSALGAARDIAAMDIGSGD